MVPKIDDIRGAGRGHDRGRGAYAVAGRARLDDDAQHDTGFFPVTDEHFVEIDANGTVFWDHFQSRRFQPIWF
jgi:hypothetical protein